MSVRGEKREATNHEVTAWRRRLNLSGDSGKVKISANSDQLDARFGLESKNKKDNNVHVPNTFINFSSKS